VALTARGGALECSAAVDDGDMPDDQTDEQLFDEPESSPEYPPGSVEYSGAVSEGSSPAPGDDPFWERLGFESWHAYMEYLRRNQSMYDPPPPVEEAAASTGLPGDELGRVRGRRREKRRRQVNLKLLADEGANLDRVARVYGVPPATLARMLVNRGVQLIIEELDG
jgi:hypothetical protein